jgi:hypothetical protein
MRAVCDRREVDANAALLMVAFVASSNRAEGVGGVR